MGIKRDEKLKIGIKLTVSLTICNEIGIKNNHEFIWV